MRNFEKCAYTYRHRKAFRYVLDKRIPKGDFYDALLARAIIHDMDKVVNLQKTSEETAKALHRKYAPHHNITSKSSDVDLMEALIDFECAGYTKTDKPFNAYDFVNSKFQKNKIDKSLYCRLMSLLTKYDMNSSYFVRDIDPQGADYFDSIVPTEEDIQKDIENYLSK